MESVERMRVLQWLNAAGVLALSDLEVVIAAGRERDSRLTRRLVTAWCTQGVMRQIGEHGAYTITPLGYHQLDPVTNPPGPSVDPHMIKTPGGALIASRLAVNAAMSAAATDGVTAVRYVGRALPRDRRTPGGVLSVQCVWDPAHPHLRPAVAIADTPGGVVLPRPGHGVLHHSIEIDTDESMAQLTERIQVLGTQMRTRPAVVGEHWQVCWYAKHRARANLIWTTWMAHAACPVFITTPDDQHDANGTLWSTDWVDEYGRLRRLNPYYRYELAWRGAPGNHPTARSLDQVYAV